MDHQQIRDAVRQSLLLPDSRTDRHNSYALRRDERRAQEALYPAHARTRVDNVVPLNPRDPEGPAAA